MKRVTIGLLATLVVASGAVLFAPARGDDSPAAAFKKIYTLDFEAGKPDTVVLGKEPNLENYWYLPFTLTNADQEDHGFFLEVTASSDKDVQYRALAHPGVKEVVRRRLGVSRGQTLWSQEDFTVAHDPTDPAAPFPRKLDLPVIKAGEKVRCVAIFHGPHPEADKIKVTVRGLTNDAIVAKTAPHERKITERVLELMYERPGDEYHRSEDSIEYVGRQWVSVDRTIKTDLE